MIRRQLGAAALALGLILGVPASSAFALGPGHECDRGHNPKCAIPEAPTPLGLPLTGLTVFGAYVLLHRQRQPKPITEETRHS